MWVAVISHFKMIVFVSDKKFTGIVGKHRRISDFGSGQVVKSFGYVRWSVSHRSFCRVKDIWENVEIRKRLENSET